MCQLPYNNTKESLIKYKSKYIKREFTIDIY